MRGAAVAAVACSHTRCTTCSPSRRRANAAGRCPFQAEDGHKNVVFGRAVALLAALLGGAFRCRRRRSLHDTQLTLGAAAMSTECSGGLEAASVAGRVVCSLSFLPQVNHETLLSAETETHCDCCFRHDVRGKRCHLQRGRQTHARRNTRARRSTVYKSNMETTHDKSTSWQLAYMGLMPQNGFVDWQLHPPTVTGVQVPSGF